MQLVFEQMNNILKQYGIEIYLYKIKLYVKEAQAREQLDEDCPDASLCIDWVVRIKCKEEKVCNELRKAYLSQHVGEQ